MQSNLLKSKRVAMKLTQATISKKLEMSKAWYNNKENNKADFSANELKKLAVLLNLSVPEFISIFFDDVVNFKLTA